MSVVADVRDDGRGEERAVPSSPVNTAPTGGRGWSRTPRRGISIERLAPLIRIVVVVAVLVGIETMVNNGTLNPLFVARPSAALETLWTNLVDGDYVGLLGTTLVSTTLAFAGAGVIGGGMGYALWRFNDLGRALDPVFVALFASPVILLYPVFLIVFGRSITAVVVQGLLGGLIPTVISMKRGFSGVNPTLLKAGHLLCTNRRQAFRFVLLPAAMPGLVAGLRLGLIYTLLTVLATEYLTAIGGVGAEISNASARLNADAMYAALIMVIALTATFMYGLSRLERAFAREGAR